MLATGRGRNGSRTTIGLTPQLNDLFFISHYHDLEDGFAHLDDEFDVGDGTETASTESVVVVKRGAGVDPKIDPLLSEAVC